MATERGKARMESTHRLNESPVLEESRLILDIIARDPCLDLIPESLQLLYLCLEICFELLFLCLVC
jgi:hypothetical protein